MRTKARVIWSVLIGQPVVYRCRMENVMLTIRPRGTRRRGRWTGGTVADCVMTKVRR